LLVLFEFSFLNTLYILVTDPLLYEELEKIFTHSVGYLFILVTIFFAVV
jgi:hypothetical protein